MPMSEIADIGSNLADVRRRMAAAAARVDRNPEDVLLVAVTKTQPIELVQAALAAGQLDFGENRPEEAWTKYADPDEPQSLVNRTVRDIYRLHLIGPIQSRKASLAVACRPVLIHSVDRVKIARRLSRFAQEADLILDALLEVNVSGEASKFGFAPEEVEGAADELVTLPGLHICGLMTMPPLEPDPEAARPFFVRLRQLRDRLALRWPQISWRHLSMGMSHDFEVAIEEGATIVRVGTAIFGSRP